MRQSKYRILFLITLCFFLYACQAKEPIRIACVGDSITYGSYLEKPAEESYPAQLQQMLGEQAFVGNFGVSGAAMSMTAKDSYWSEQARKDSEAFSPDIVLLMLGTNDSLDENWQSKEAFLQDCEMMIAFYSSLSSKPHVYLVTPSSSFILEGNDDLVRGMHQKRISEIRDWLYEYAKDQQLDMIDLYTLTKDVPQYYMFDGVHPNRAGARFIANTIASSIIQDHKLSLVHEN